MISGETIRQTAEERAQTCPEAMKNSFYYGFREGAKWMQAEMNDSLGELFVFNREQLHEAKAADHKIYQEDFIRKACRWIENNRAHFWHDGDVIGEFRKAMKEQ